MLNDTLSLLWYRIKVGPMSKQVCSSVDAEQFLEFHMSTSILYVWSCVVHNNRHLERAG